ncbi:hypothetical protein F5X99DRAFT_424032 [Biscogniauxia marginata]|nr:hypothetical protein F5X99DRAFT_424032 [Biscogniauxia marginata]
MLRTSQTLTTATPKPHYISNTSTTLTRTTTVNSDGPTTNMGAHTASTGDSATSTSRPTINSTSIPTSNTKHSSQTQPRSPTPPASKSTGNAASQLKIPGSENENEQLARQIANHPKYLCCELPHYYVCGHPEGPKELLLSRNHVKDIGYGLPCNDGCNVDDSRRLILGDRCPACATVEECLSVVMKYACGHLAGIQISPGARHEMILGARQRCDPYCRSVQVDLGIGGACKQCTWSYCCMIWAKYRCGHRDGILCHLLVGAHHILNLGSSQTPCDARCHFRHKERIVGEYCTRLPPLPAPVSPTVLEPALAPMVDLVAGPSMPSVASSISPLRHRKVRVPVGLPRKEYYENMRW